MKIEISNQILENLLARANGPTAQLETWNSRLELIGRRSNWVGTWP